MPSYPLAGCRVLIVENDYSIAKDLTQTLTMHGAEIVGPVSNLMDASKKIVEERFDVVTLDAGLEDCKSFALAKDLRSKTIPFLFATGYSDDVIPPAWADVPRLEKPCKVSELVRHIELLCRS